MYNPAFQTVISDARTEALRRSGEASRQTRRNREGNQPRPTGRWGLLSRAGIRRLAFADPSRAN